MSTLETDKPVIRFTVPGLPIAQPRQRSKIQSFGGKMFTKNYTPAKSPVNAFKASVQLFASQAYRGPLLNQPLELTLTFRLERKGCHNKKKNGNGRLYATKTPDLDNLMKSVCDALNKVVWEDDKFVTVATMHKYIAAADEAPGVDVEIRVLSALPAQPRQS